jgi:hypothetical protein
VRYAQLEYTGEDPYTLASMRHTGKWQEAFSGLTLEECISTFSNAQIFWP